LDAIAGLGRSTYSVWKDWAVGQRVSAGKQKDQINSKLNVPVTKLKFAFSVMPFEELEAEAASVKTWWQ
jgi:hypothetical protein